MSLRSSGESGNWSGRSSLIFFNVHMDFHLLQRVRSKSAQESLKKLKRPKVKLKSPEWMQEEEEYSIKKRTRVFFPEDDDDKRITSSSSQEEEEEEEEEDISDVIYNLRKRLRHLENQISDNTKLQDHKKATKKRLSFESVKKTPKKKVDQGLRIDPILNRKRSFWDYVLDDFDWRSVSTPREALTEQQRLNNFQQIPWAIESLQCFGFLVCFDTLLYVFTIVPVRVILASIKCLLSALTWPIAKLSGINNTMMFYVGRRHVYDIFRGFLLISTCGLLYYMQLSRTLFSLSFSPSLF